MTFKFLKMILTTCRYAMCISLGVLSVSGTASATLIESIDALEEGAMYRVLFVTSTATNASSSDIEYYNAFVSTAAVSGSVTGGLGLTWKALASTASINAQENTGILNSDNTTVTLFNTFGEIIATSGADLWDELLSATVHLDESGVDGQRYVWTGTRPNGQPLDGETLGTIAPWAGISTFVNKYAFKDDVTLATSEYGVYGVSNVVSKPLTDVPEPGTFILLSLGLAGLSFARYRKQS
jgi:hypothetical protein